MEGRGHVRIGRLPWMPINIWMHHRLGRDYVGLIRVRPAGLTVLSVIDAYVDGAGITKIGPAASIGAEVDQGAFLGMWAAAVAYPSTWSGGVRWRAVNEHSARVWLPFGNGSEEARLDFDPSRASRSVSRQIGTGRLAGRKSAGTATHLTGGHGMGFRPRDGNRVVVRSADSVV